MQRYFSPSYLFFIAKRIHFNKEGEKQISSPIIRIAIISTALSLTTMILSVAIVVGFKKEVLSKVIGFGSHIQITNFDNNIFHETHPITIDVALLEKLKHIPNIHHIQSFATKPAIIKTKDNFQGVILKGVDKDFDWNFFKQNLIEGNIPKLHSDLPNTNVILSKNIANKLHLKVNDTFTCYFIQNSIKMRKYRIAGIYQTNFVNYDKLFILCNIIQIRRLSNWDEDMISGLEILVNDYKHLDQILDEIHCKLSAQTDRLGNRYHTHSIKQFNPTIFTWLNLLDINMVFILLLMLLVAGFSMISILLIIILERVQMIGILKVIGENNTGIRKIFLYVSVFLIGRGLIWGNAIALFICLIQKYTGILKLNPEIYYVSTVPIYLNVIHLFLINFGTIIITLSILIIPSYIVAKISPVKIIRFE